MQFPFGPDSDDENDKKNKNGGDRERGKRVNPLGNPFLVRAMEQRAEAKGAALEAEPMGAMDLSMKMGRQLLDQARRKEGALGARLRAEMETAGFSFGSRGAIGFKDPKERARGGDGRQPGQGTQTRGGDGREPGQGTQARGAGKSTSIALTTGRGAKRQEDQPMQTTEMVRSALNRPFGGEGARNQGDPLAFLNARLPDTDEDDLLEAEGLISAAETTLAEQSANADDPLTAKLIATRAEEAKAMMAALAGEKAIRETSVPSPSFETVTASPPQDEGETENSKGLKGPHPEGSNDPVSKGGASKGDDITATPHPEEAAPAAVSKGEGSGGSATTGTDTTDEARAARRDDTRAIDALAEGRERARLASGDETEAIQIASADTGFQSDASSGATTATSPEDPPADFDAERNEAPRQSDAQARERDVQPLGAAARRSFEAIDAAERELERQRRRQRAMSRDTAEDRDDPATRGQRQQAVSAEIERAEDQLGKVRTEARDAIMERLVTGSLDPASAKAEAETVFGTDDPVVGQVQAAGVVAGLRELEERALDKPENAGAAADFVAGLRGEAEQDGSLTAEASQYFDNALDNIGRMTTQAGVLEEANRELDRLATEIEALEQKRAGEGLNARERRQLRGLKASQQAAVDKAADAQAAFDEAAEPLVKLDAARALAALMETAESPEQLRDELFNVAEATLDGAAGGALAGLVTGATGGPAGAAFGASLGAVIGFVANGAATFLARQGIDPADLAALPRLLKEDPAKAIAIIDDIGDAKFVAAFAGSLAGGIKLTPKPGFDLVDTGIGAAASEGFKTLRRQ